MNHFHTFLLNHSRREVGAVLKIGKKFCEHVNAQCTYLLSVLMIQESTVWGSTVLRGVSVHPRTFTILPRLKVFSLVILNLHSCPSKSSFLSLLNPHFRQSFHLTLQVINYDYSWYRNRNFVPNRYKVVLSRVYISLRLEFLPSPSSQ